MIRNRFLQVEGVDRHITDIGALQMVERCGAGCHVVGAQHPAFVADLSGAEACSRPVRGADVHRDAAEGDVKPFGGGLRGQAHEGGGAAEARHLVSAKGLVERHGRTSCLLHPGCSGRGPRQGPAAAPQG
jgi:hypothetical protein